MLLKRAVTAILLAFVGISIIYLVAGKGAQKPNEIETTDKANISENINKISTAKPALPSNSMEESPAEQVLDNQASASKVIAYYFHGTRRCATCQTIEAYAEESLKASFLEELEKETLEWRVVNVEEPGQEHFVKDYELSTRSVVLVRMLDGKQESWKNLGRVWELVRDKEAFFTYIHDETRSFLIE